MKFRNLILSFFFLFCVTFQAAGSTSAGKSGSGATSRGRSVPGAAAAGSPGAVGVNASGENVSFLWQAVLSGKVLSEPALLSYGFCVITDAKKIDCISFLGVKVWEKEIPYPRTSSAFALSDDFILVCQNNSGIVSLLNPSGLCLWERQIDFECKGALSLWDGRFLIFGSSEIICFGINGIKKWQIKNESQNLILNDCTFLPQTDNEGYIYFELSDSRALKISPFGKYEISSYDFEMEKKILSEKKEIEEKLVKENFSRERIKKAFLTPELDLVLCKEDWNIELYSLLTREEKKKYSHFFTKESKKSYRNFYNLNQIYSIITNNDEISDQIRLKKLSDGLYGEDEITYASEALNVLQSYQNEINTNQFGDGIVHSEYEANAKDFEVVIKQIPLFASSDFSKVSADYISHTKNFAVLKLILQSVSECGYDPDLQILSAIQKRTRNISYKNEEILCAMCDAIFEICRFMGRSAYYKKGKLILADFLSSQNTNRVKAHARKTFSKIKLLEL